MNINIANGDLNGFLNLNHSKELELVPTNSATLIAAPFHFTSLAEEEFGVLGLMFDRLKYGGTLKLGGYDAVEFAKQILRQTIEPSTRNQLVRGFQNLMSLEEVTELVVRAGFKIESRKLDGVTFLIEAMK
jgi:hypothetical protein